MAIESISPLTLIATDGTVKNFSGGSAAIQDLRDSNASTGIHIVSNNGNFRFIFGVGTDLDFLSEDCTFKYQLELLGGGTKSSVTVSIPALSITVGTFAGAASAGTIIEHTLPSGINPSVIVNNNSNAGLFQITDSTGNTKISEVSMLINRPDAGKIQLTSGKIQLTSGKITL